ncbi:ATP-binding protein [Nocardia grenadensis]|uniref:ATP-binding protein n=1 Tax=Nocardia grenadensis TaxID=931537 RepID=UPI003D717ECB
MAVKIAFVGKGGSGKTTLSSLFIRQLAAQAVPVLAIDADINQHLATALGATEEESAALPTLADHLPLIKDHLRGDNPRIPSGEAMLKTTPPGNGSRLLGVVEDNPIYSACVREIQGARLMVTGRFSEEELGVACYHSKVGAAEMLLNHMVDLPGEYVVVDMTAGADSFASGLFTRFDLTALVCEPTLRSVGVYRQYLEYAKDFGIRIAVIGNKISDEQDLEFLREQVGNDLLCWIGRSAHVRAAERGDIRPITDLEPDNRNALGEIRAALDTVDRDWKTYHHHTVQFHIRNAEAWAGRDVITQIDPDFALGPDLRSGQSAALATH